MRSDLWIEIVRKIWGGGRGGEKTAGRGVNRGKTVGDAKVQIEIGRQRETAEETERKDKRREPEGEHRTGKRHREKQKDCTGGDNEGARG